MWDENVKLQWEIHVFCLPPFINVFVGRFNKMKKRKFMKSISLAVEAFLIK